MLPGITMKQKWKCQICKRAQRSKPHLLDQKVWRWTPPDVQTESVDAAVDELGRKERWNNRWILYNRWLLPNIPPQTDFLDPDN